MASPPTEPSLPVTSSSRDGTVERTAREEASPHPTSTTRRQFDKEHFARTFSNMIILGGTVVCLGLAIAAISHVDSETTMVFLLLVPAFFSGGCLLTLVNVSWMSRRPGKRCSLVQMVCNLVLGLMTVYVELLFWPVRPDLALAILCGAALPMFVFINMPSAFMTNQEDYIVMTGAAVDGDAKTVIMEDDEHSLFSLPSESGRSQGTDIEQQQLSSPTEEIATTSYVSNLDQQQRQTPHVGQTISGIEMDFEV
ncbi:expressed unknown protein [Seminavis robusta]|uniref:Transmembrane protein n=1 Tax=Seminavis robusta TaxID=568900 RepID=A0A9N8EU76_9STRA|nr:expressed unknown protein [Seminavis robusta]|eukprot:Sro2189_g318250.1 n/a (253) ;mRNA; f:8946-9704